MQELDKFNVKVNVMPNGLEKYMSFTINNKLDFIDSFQFTSSFLNSLVKNLNKYNFKYLSQELDNNVLDQVKQKWFYPFEYMTDFENFLKNYLATKSFLVWQQVKISDKEYNHFLNVWNKLMKDYHDLYLKCDVLLSADVFDKFRNNSLNNCGLCPSHYLIALTYFRSVFFEKGMRGGVSYISNRYSKANSKYSKSYDPKQESKHIIYLNVDKLYGDAIFNFSPRSGFKWIDPKKLDLNKYTSNSSKRCVLKVDLEYLKELRESRNDCPLASDKTEIKRETLSEYQLQIADL